MTWNETNLSIPESQVLFTDMNAKTRVLRQLSRHSASIPGRVVPLNLRCLKWFRVKHFTHWIVDWDSTDFKTYNNRWMLRLWDIYICHGAYASGLKAFLRDMSCKYLFAFWSIPMLLKRVQARRWCIPVKLPVYVWQECWMYSGYAPNMEINAVSVALWQSFRVWRALVHAANMGMLLPEKPPLVGT